VFGPGSLYPRPVVSYIAVLALGSLLVYLVGICVLTGYYLTVRPHPALRAGVLIQTFSFLVVLSGEFVIILLPDIALTQDPIRSTLLLLFIGVSRALVVRAVLVGTYLFLGWKLSRVNKIVINAVAGLFIFLSLVDIVLRYLHWQGREVLPWLTRVPLNSLQTLATLLVCLGAFVVWHRFRGRLFHPLFRDKVANLWIPGLTLVAQIPVQLYYLFGGRILTREGAGMVLWSLFSLTMGWWSANLGLGFFSLPKTEIPLPNDTLEAFCVRFALSAREKEVAQLLLQGLVLKEVGARLGISTNTVRNHNANLFRKVQVSTRAELVHKILLGTN